MQNRRLFTTAHRCIVFCLAVFLFSSLTAQENTSQVKRLINEPNIPFDSVAMADDTTAIYLNPAGIGIHPLQVGYFFGRNEEADLTDHTLFLNAFGFAFSSQWRFAPEGEKVNIYSLGTGLFSSKSFSLGTTYSWLTQDNTEVGDFNQWDVGLIMRPWERLSLGLVVRALNGVNADDPNLSLRYDFGFSFRPFPFGFQIPLLGSIIEALIPQPENFSFSMDFTWTKGQAASSLTPRYNFEYLPFTGITLYGGWNSDKNIFFGTKFNLPTTQLSMQANFPSIIENDLEKKGNFYSGGFLISKENLPSVMNQGHRLLLIDLNLPYIESKESGSFFTDENITFFELLNAIKRAETDNQIGGILLRGYSFRGGWAQAEELRNSLTQFKLSSRKPVYGFFENLANKEYYIATACDKISMPESGTVILNGLSSDSYYLKDLLEKVGIKADFIARGKYKSAPHMFTRNTISEDDKQQRLQLVNDVLRDLEETILRNFPRQNQKENSENAIENSGEKEILKNIFQQGIFSASKAVEKNLIDQSDYLSEFLKSLHENPEAANATLTLKNFINRDNYDDSWSQKPVIAVLVIEGEIILGRKEGAGIFTDRLSASEDIIDSLRLIRSDPNIEAVIIRVNSPGGSAVASDLIWHEIKRLKEVKKQVVISMGDVAASGGYYVAMAGDHIFASENSITGSIGVFTGKFSFKDLYEKIGVKKINLKTHENSSLFNEENEFSPSERKALESYIDEVYDKFINKVIQNRTNLNRDEILMEAEGKVFSGNYAHKKKMIDTVGGLMLAKEMVRTQLGLRENSYELLFLPRKEKKLFDFSRSLMMNLLTQLPAILKDSIRSYEMLEKMSDDKIWLLMPSQTEIK